MLNISEIKALSELNGDKLSARFNKQALAKDTFDENMKFYKSLGHVWVSYNFMRGDEKPLPEDDWSIVAMKNNAASFIKSLHKIMNLNGHTDYEEFKADYLAALNELITKVKQDDTDISEELMIKAIKDTNNLFAVGDILQPLNDKGQLEDTEALYKALCDFYKKPFIPASAPKP